MCDEGLGWTMKRSYGTWGGFSSSATLAALPPDSLGSEFIAFAISNGAQFLYSLLYLLLIYNLSLISMEHEWGKWETNRKRPRCTIVSGRPFEQSYFLQLPWKVITPLMIYASLMHWLLGQAISTTETIYTDHVHRIEHSIYFVSVAAWRFHICVPWSLTVVLDQRLLMQRTQYSCRRFWWSPWLSCAGGPSLIPAKDLYHKCRSSNIVRDSSPVDHFC